MALHEFQCRDPKCGHTYTIRRNMGAGSNPEPCPRCGGWGDRIMSANMVNVPGGTPTHHRRVR